MVYNIFIGEAKGLNTVEALERTKTDISNQSQIGFIKATVQSAINDSLSNLKVW